MMMWVDFFPKQTILRAQEDLDLNEKIDLAENATSRETSISYWVENGIILQSQMFICKIFWRVKDQRFSSFTVAAGSLYSPVVDKHCFFLYFSLLWVASVQKAIAVFSETMSYDNVCIHICDFSKNHKLNLQSALWNSQTLLKRSIIEMWL